MRPAITDCIVRTRQRGVAIVLAMGVVVLAALAATAMLTTQSTWLRQIDLTASHNQAQLIIQAGLDWSRAVLSDDRRVSIIDSLDETWALRLPPIPVENGNLAGNIDDQQGKFNLNNLLKNGKINLAQLANFRRLLTTLALPPSLADALADWIDVDSEPQPQDGAEDAYYLALQSPYLPPNQPLIDVSELALVRGYDETVRTRLRPFVTALPRYTTVNVNTAPAEVLVAVIDSLNLDGARAIVTRRTEAPFRSTADFVGQLPPGLNVPMENISVNSDFFVATMRITLSGVQAQGSALLVRSTSGWPAILWRKHS